jgi:hypothetical protein
MKWTSLPNRQSFETMTGAVSIDDEGNAHLELSGVKHTLARMARLYGSERDHEPLRGNRYVSQGGSLIAT